MMVTSKLSALSKDMDSLAIESSEDMEMAALFRSEAKTYLDRLEQIRVKYKRPFLDHMTDTDKAFRLLAGAVVKSVTELDERIKIHVMEEKRKAAEEEKLRELQRQKDEEERLKLIEEEKTKLEQSGVKVDKSAEEIAKESEGFRAMITGTVEVAPGVEMKVDTPKEVIAPAPTPPKKLSEQTGGLLQGKTIWRWKVTDAGKIPQNYLMVSPQLCDDPGLVMMAPRSFLIPNEKLIDSAVTKGQVREIDGIHIFEDIELASKKFRK
jgi:hypothetical protein